MRADGITEVSTERLVRLQRKLHEYRTRVFIEPYRVKNGLEKLAQEVDSILLGEAGEKEEGRKYDTSDD